MGLHDRDWYQEALAQKGKAKKNDLYDFKTEFERLERKMKKKTVDWGIAFFWLAALGTLTVLMAYLLKAKL